MLLVLVGWSSPVVAAWEVVHPGQPKNVVLDACWGNGVFVSVGELGAIKTSVDGLNWTPQKTVTQNNLSSVVFTGTRFVAAGTGGTILWSEDGVNWRFTSASTTADFTRVKMVNGALFAIGKSVYNGIIYRSADDGNTWQIVVDDADQLDTLADLVYFGGQYIAMARNSSKAWRSNNLESWARDMAWNSPLSSVHWADVVDGKLVMANGIVVHTIDGTNWAQSNFVSGISKVVVFGGAYYGVGKSGPSSSAAALRSTDLVAWERLGDVGAGVLCAGGGKLLSIETTGTLGGTPGDDAWVSSDGMAWERHQNWHRSSPIFAGGFFRVAIGNFLYSSIDGETWTSSRLPVGFNASWITFSNGKYFVSGKMYDPNLFDGKSAYLLSDDAVNWTIQLSPLWYGPVFAFGKWFSGGRQSTDGLTWTLPSDSAKNIGAFAAGNGVLVSVKGASNFFEWWTSSDGANWTYRYSYQSDGGGSSVAFGNGIFVCVGSYTSVIRTSTNGVSWTKRTPPPGSMGYYNSVSFVNDRFVATGDGGTMDWSLDGITWHAASYPVWGNMFRPVYGNSTWLIRGEFVTLKSSDFANWTRLTDYTAINFKKVRYLNGQFWALDRTQDNIITGSLWRSTDGRAWTLMHRFNFEPVDIAFGNGTYVVASNYQKAAYSTNGGATWSEVTVSSVTQAAIAFGLGRFTIVGQRVICHSPDGINWSTVTPVDAPLFNDVAATSLGLFAVGTRSGNGMPNIYRSIDGTTWGPVIPVDIGVSMQTYQTIMETGGAVHFGGTNGNLLKTTDGLVWTTLLQSGSSYLSSFQGQTVSPHGFVKVSLEGTLTYTRDLIGFTDFRAIPLGTSRMRSVAFGNGIFVAVGEHGTIVRSEGLPDFATPQSPSFSETGDRFLEFSWAVPPGAQPAGLEVRYRSVGQTTWKTAPSIFAAPGYPLRLSGLEPATGYELSVRAIYPGGASEFVDFSSAATVTLAAIEYWRKGIFGTTSGTGNSADDADPDHDGKSNLLEYALGSDPRLSDAPDEAFVRWQRSGSVVNGYFTFPCDALRSDIDWEVWRSFDGLSNWVRVARCVNGGRCVSSGAFSVLDPYLSTTSSTEPRRNVTVEIQTNRPSAFFRLAVVPNR